MRHCPSHDWDRHCQEQDDATAAEIAWWKRHGRKVLQVVCSMLGGMHPGEVKCLPPDQVRELVDQAASIVREITGRADDEP